MQTISRPAGRPIFHRPRRTSPRSIARLGMGDSRQGFNRTAWTWPRRSNRQMAGSSGRRSEEGQADRARTGLAQQERARCVRASLISGHQSRHQHKGRASYKLDLCDAARHRQRRSLGARASRSFQADGQTKYKTFALTGPNGVAIAPPDSVCAIPRRMVAVRVHRNRREGRRRRLHRGATGTKRVHAVGVRIADSASTRRSRCCAERSSAIAGRSDRLGEEVHFKADSSFTATTTGDGIRLCPSGTDEERLKWARR